MNRTPRPRRCPCCLDMFTPVRIGLKLAKCCLNATCVLDYAQGVKAKEQATQYRQDKKDFYRKTIKWQHSQNRIVFNKLRRLEELKWFKDRGQQPTCISCGGELGGDVWACGHFKTVGASGQLRYDTDNTKLQHNKRCNKDLSGDIYGTATTRGYIRGLYERFGEEEAQRIINYCETNNAVKKWNWQEMEADRKGWAERIRKLERELS
jgi:hypothetical protein